MTTRTIIQEVGFRVLSTVFALAVVGRGAAAAPAPPPVAAGTPAPARSPAVAAAVVIDAVRAPSGSDIHGHLTRALAATAGTILPASAAGCASVDCLSRVAATRRAGQVILLTGAPNTDEGYDLRVESWTPTGVRQSQGTCNFCTAADTAALAGRLISGFSTLATATASASAAASAPASVPTSVAAPAAGSAPVGTPVAGQSQFPSRLSSRLPSNGWSAPARTPPPASAPPATASASAPAGASASGAAQTPIPLTMPAAPSASPEPAFRPAADNGTGRTLGVVLLAGAAAAGAAGGVLLLLDGSETGCTDFTSGRVCDGQRSTAAAGFVAIGFGVALAVAGGVVLYESAGGDRLASLTVGPGNIHLTGRF